MQLTVIQEALGVEQAVFNLVVLHLEQEEQQFEVVVEQEGLFVVLDLVVKEFQVLLQLLVKHIQQLVVV